MLRIIPTPKDKEVLYTIPAKEEWESGLRPLRSEYGIYFEYVENDILRFRFLYVQEKIAILKDSFSSELSKEQVEAFFHCSISLDDLWKWLDEVPFEIKKCLDVDDPSIRGIWKMEDVIVIRGDSKIHSILKNYYEFQVSTATIRSIPYNCWSNDLRFEVLNETDKIYWITLCLLKYQRQLNQQSEE